MVETIKSDKKVSHLLDNYFLRSNVIEFKSFYESLEISEFFKTLGKFVNYLVFVDDFNTKDNALFYIITHYPSKLFKSDYFKNYINIEQIESGVYRIKDLVPGFIAYIIVINQLDLNELTMPLLKFSNGQIKRRFIKFLWDNIHEKKYAALLVDCYYYNPMEVKEILGTEVTQVISVEDNIRMAVKDIGIKKVVDAVGIEKVMNALGPVRVLMALSEEKLMEELKKSKKLDENEIKQLIELISKIKNK